MRTNSLSRVASLALGTAVLVGARTAGAAAPEENDLLDSFQPNTLVTFSLTSAGVASSPGSAVAYGGASLSTSTPFCVAEPTVPCFYTLNHLLVYYRVRRRYEPRLLLVQQSLRSHSGSAVGLGLRTRNRHSGDTTAEAGATINGPNVSNLFQANAEQVTGSLVLSMTPETGFLSLNGELPFNFSISELGQSFFGTISGFVDGNTPFLNTAPIANAGAPISVVCPQTVTLSGDGTADLQSNITDFSWSFSSLPFATVDGPTASVFLGEGTTVATLTVTDVFNGIGRAQVPVTVTIPPPTFGGAPSSQVVQSCSAGSSAVPISVPQALVCGASVPVAATVTSFNGASVFIPVVGGSVGLPPARHDPVRRHRPGRRLHHLRSNDTVLAPVTFFGSHGFAVDDGSSVKGTLYAGPGGQTLLQDDVTVGNVVSLSPVVLQDRVTATLIDSGAGLTFGHTDHVASTSSGHARPGPSSPPRPPPSAAPTPSSSIPPPSRATS